MIFKSILSHDALWGLFVLGAVLTLFFASKTVKYFTVYITRSRFNASVMGAIILSLITSLPELTNGIISGTTGHSSLAYSNATGADVILMLFFGIFLLIFSKKSLLQVPSKNLIKLFGFVAVSTFLFAILFFTKESITVSIGDHSFSIAVFLQFFLYLGFLFISIRNKNDIDEEPSEDLKTKIKSTKGIIAAFFFFSLCLVVSAILLNNVVDKIGEPKSEGGYGLGTTIAGAIFLSIVTTIPEITSMFKLMKIGLFNVAASAAVGSQLFNFTVLFFSDLIDSNSLLEQVYENEGVVEQTYIWVIYIINFVLMGNLVFNKWLKQNEIFRMYTAIHIPLTFATSWTIFGVTS